MACIFPRDRSRILSAPVFDVLLQIHLLTETLAGCTYFPCYIHVKELVVAAKQSVLSPVIVFALCCLQRMRVVGPFLSTDPPEDPNKKGLKK